MALVALTVVVEAYLHRGDDDLLRLLHKGEELVRHLKRDDTLLAQILDELLNPQNPASRDFRNALECLLPQQVRGRGPLTREHVARYLAGGWGYAPRNLFRALLEHLLSQIGSLGGRHLAPCPCRAEWILALAPIPTLHQAFLEIVERSWGKGIQGAVAALFLHGFLRDGRAQPTWPSLFRNWSPYGVKLKKGSKKGELLKNGFLPVMERRGNQALVVHLNHGPAGKTLASPQLKGNQGLAKAWYADLDRHLEKCLDGRSPANTGCLFPAQDTYDWDLVEEYHEYLLGAPPTNANTNQGGA